MSSYTASLGSVALLELLASERDDSAFTAHAQSHAMSHLEAELAETRRKLCLAQTLADTMTQQAKESRLLAESIRSQAQHATQNYSSQQFELQNKSTELSSLSARLHSLQLSTQEQQLAIDTSNRAMQAQKAELADIKASKAMVENELRAAQQLAQHHAQEILRLRDSLLQAENEKRGLEWKRGELEREAEALQH